MPYQYILHEKAQEEYENSLKWYKEKSTQAAVNFVIAIDNTLELICTDPYKWRNEYRNYHELGLKNILSALSIRYSLSSS